MSKRPAKIIGKADMKCDSCRHVRGSVCRHPQFENLHAKPLIIAEQGETYPVFCPLKKKVNNLKGKHEHA